MTVLFRREVPVREVVAVDARQARALGAPIRLTMLDLLALRPMSIEELARELPSHGFRKAPNTLRHHLEILTKAGLVELAILEQTRGAVLKSFAASVRPLHYHVPVTSEGDLQALSDRIYPTLTQSLEDLARHDGALVRKVASSLRRCPRCPESRYTEFVLLAALQRASAEFLRRKRSTSTHAGKAATSGRTAPARPRVAG